MGKEKKKNGQKTTIISRKRGVPNLRVLHREKWGVGKEKKSIRGKGGGPKGDFLPTKGRSCLARKNSPNAKKGGRGGTQRQDGDQNDTNQDSKKSRPKRRKCSPTVGAKDGLKREREPPSGT